MICSVNGVYHAESAHAIEGDRLIITDPVETFRGATDRDPYTLMIQYDY